jgi:hypothetical protein
MIELYNQRNTVGGLSTSDVYWSSTQSNTTNALFQFFDKAAQGAWSKTSNYFVRPIRAF